MNRASKGLLLASVFILPFCSANQAYAVGATCTPTPSNLVFGDVTNSVISSQTADTTATISFSCTGAGKNSAIRICIQLDSFNASNTRTMTSGGNSLVYQIYKDAAHTQVWGYNADGNVMTIDATTDGTGSYSSSITMYGRILTAQTTAPPGSYSHSIPASSNNEMTVLQNAGAAPCTSISGNPKTFALTNTATISNHCTISATSLNFGSSPYLTSQVTSTNTVSALCTNSTSYTIGLDGGLVGATNPTQRKMSYLSNQITYGIYQSSGTTQPWGNTVGSNVVSGSGTGLTQNYTGFGVVPAQSGPVPGSYSDTIVVTVTY